MRTLVISDLHLGSRLGHDVLTRPEPLRRLLAALDGVDRLVLLGDIVELMEGRTTIAMSTAEPILRAIGDRLGNDREIVLVPGNHDRPLVRTWIRDARPELTLDTAVPPDATEVLARQVEWLGAERVSVRYPGVWLSERTWATHGHYLDLHLMPRSAVGFMRSGHPDRARPRDYERGRRPSATRFSRWLPRPLAAGLNDASDMVRAALMPQVRHLLRPNHSNVTSGLLGFQMRRAAIPALSRVLEDLRVGADWVIFGHVHRSGPLPGDDLADWRSGDGRTRLVNSGSWLYEPRLVHRARTPHPYWPGGAVLLEDGADPRAIGLLDDVSASELQ